MMIQKDEATAARRRVPARIFTSNGTAPDTGATDDAVIMGVNSATTISLTSTLRPMNTAQGMYWVELTQSETSVLGVHPLYHTAGDFPQHIANVEIISFQPYSTVSVFDPSAHSVGLKAVTHSQATIGGVQNYSNLSGNVSNLTVQVSSGTVSGVANAVLIRDGAYSAVSVRLDSSAIPAGAFQAGAIDAAALAAMNLSDVTVRVHPMAYSGLTVEVNNLVGDFSAASVRISGGTATGVTNRVTANVDRLNGVAAPILRLLSHISSVVTGVASAGSLAVNAMTSDVAETTNDHFNGRVIVFTTGVLLGQATSINTSGGYIGFSDGSSRFHFPALTEAPSANDEFVIV